MARFHEEVAQSGALLDAAGLWPSAERWHITSAAVADSRMAPMIQPGTPASIDGESMVSLRWRGR